MQKGLSPIETGSGRDSSVICRRRPDVCHDSTRTLPIFIFHLDVHIWISKPRDQARITESDLDAWFVLRGVWNHLSFLEWTNFFKSVADGYCIFSRRMGRWNYFAF